MSRFLPASTTSGEDLKQPPTNSYRFGCPIKPSAVIPSSRMEWMRSYCHTNFSRHRLRLRSGRSRVPICSLPSSRSSRFYYSTCVFMDSFPVVFPSMYACFLHPDGCPIEFLSLCSVHHWDTCLPSTCSFHRNPCPRTYTDILSLCATPDLPMSEVSCIQQRPVFFVLL